MMRLKWLPVLMVIPLASLLLLGFANRSTALGFTRSNPIAVAPTAAPYCTVTENHLNVRANPDLQANVITHMQSGVLFTPVERTKDKVWIRGDSTNAHGWVAARFLNCPFDLVRLPITMQASPTPTSQPVQPSPTSSKSSNASNQDGTITLIEPLEPKIAGRRTFKWQSTLTPGPNQAYEMVVWPVGQNPLTNGLALVGAKLENTITVDLEKAASFLPKFTKGKEYQWGVLLVQIHPYRRIQYLGGGQRFLFAAPEAQTESKSNSHGAKPTPEQPPAPPK